MTDNTLVDRIMQWEDGSMSEPDTIAFFQELVDSGMAWQLQGMYGRQAAAFIHAGLVHDTNNVLTASARNTKRESEVL